MEIVNSRISVFEIELDLKNWEYQISTDVPGFTRCLTRTIPSLQEHKCMVGEPGGFISEVKKGTNFAHVIEHVLLELLHLADPDKIVYNGWTRENSDSKFIIHYNAPNFLSGRLAAMLSVELVKNLIAQEKVVLSRYLKILRNPVQYFTEIQKIQDDTIYSDEPISIIQELEQSQHTIAEISLTDVQKLNIIGILQNIKKHMKILDQIWHDGFLNYSGKFGDSILDKIEILSLNQFIPTILQNKFDNFFQGIFNVGKIIQSYQIPSHFVFYAVNLYKNNLISFIVNEYETDENFLHAAIKDFEMMYQIIFLKLKNSFQSPRISEKPAVVNEVKAFRELKNNERSLLLVDDDEIVRKTSAEILQYHGFKVYQAKDGHQAVSMFMKHLDEVELVVLDLLMPGMGGMEVYAAMKKIRPDVKVLLTSGYPVDVKTKEVANNEFVSFLNKPFTFEKLKEKVDLMLNNSDHEDIIR